MSDMTLFQSVILGIVEGVTEYLPVSSTGHLLLTQQLLHIGQTVETKEAADAYAVVIQAGAILAVAGLYFTRLKGVVEGLLGRNPEGFRLGINLMAGFMPAAVIGLVFEKWIKAHLFGLWPVVAAWFTGGLAILAVEAWRRRSGTSRASGKGLAEITWKMALVIGVAQVVAMWPGVSRSLITILGGLAMGLSMVAAVEFSFLLGLITLGAATAHETLKCGHAIVHSYGIVTPLVGLAVSLLSALLAITWLVRYLQRHPLSLFGYYRILLAGACGLWLLMQ